MAKKGTDYFLRDLHPVFWEAVKIAAVKEGVTIKQYIINALTDRLTKKKTKKKGRLTK